MTGHLTTREAARLLQVTVGTLRGWLDVGLLHATRDDSSRWLISQHALDELCGGLEPPFLRAGPAAKLLHVTTRTLARWTDDGAIPSVLLPSGHRRYPQAEMQRLADAGKTSRRALRQPAPEPAAPVTLTDTEQQVLAAFGTYQGGLPLPVFIADTCRLPCPDTARFVLASLADKGLIGQRVTEAEGVLPVSPPSGTFR